MMTLLDVAGRGDDMLDGPDGPDGPMHMEPVATSPTAPKKDNPPPITAGDLAPVHELHMMDVVKEDNPPTDGPLHMMDVVVEDKPLRRTITSGGLAPLHMMDGVKEDNLRMLDVVKEDNPLLRTGSGGLPESPATSEEFAAGFGNLDEAAGGLGSPVQSSTGKRGRDQTAMGNAAMPDQTAMGNAESDGEQDICEDCVNAKGNAEPDGLGSPVMKAPRRSWPVVLVGASPDSPTKSLGLGSPKSLCPVNSPANSLLESLLSDASPEKKMDVDEKADSPSPTPKKIVDMDSDGLPDWEDDQDETQVPA
jgi:hypothetical protein